MPPILRPNKTTKREETSYTRRTNQLLKEADNELEEIYGFSSTQRTTRQNPLRNRDGEITRVETIVIYIEDRFYSKDRARLYQYYRNLLARSATHSSNTNVIWQETSLQIDESLKNQVDNGILRTRIDSNTEQESIIEHWK